MAAMTQYQPGDEVDGYRLTDKGAWEPIPGQGRPWQVGDVANGYRLSADGTWTPLDRVKWNEKHPNGQAWIIVAILIVGLPLLIAILLAAFFMNL